MRKNGTAAPSLIIWDALCDLAVREGEKEDAERVVIYVKTLLNWRHVRDRRGGGRNIKKSVIHQSSDFK